ncbi:uncharacterized protein LOC118219178 [Anguilla anguilla]|uniref:uncharacterized protein LOC118219178 n=1 Tax=Anguilla anguilla TaxID=7936 RepID=UPI0015B2987E|nr:uncharacterized protein LOC118219178 [Anguilla anguilla]
MLKLNLDFEKAYDRVSHQYMFHVLRKMGFPEGFLARVGLLYTEVRSKILVNGRLSKTVAVNCGVRQGCPLSPLLFVCCVEPLAQILRRDTWISGVKIPGSGGREARCILYMDDVTVLASDAVSVARVLDLTEFFGQASGARLNKDKTVLKVYGEWTQRELQSLPIKTDDKDMKVLGVRFDKEGLGGKNWEDVLMKVKKKLQFWSFRYLTYEGKVLILKSVFLPLLLFFGVVFVPSRSVLARLDFLVFRVFWGGGWERLQRVWVKKERGKGGKGVPDFNRILMCQFVALHVSLCVNSENKASCFVRFFIGGFLRRLGILKTNQTQPVAFDMPVFYQPFKKFLAVSGLEGEGAETLSSYHNMLSFVHGRDDTCAVRGLALGQAEEVWKAVAHPDLLNRHKDLAWLAAHKILPVRQVMTARRMMRTAVCPQTGCTHEETVRHLLWDCCTAQALWNKLTPLVKLMGFKERLKCHMILYGDGHLLKTEKWRPVWQVLNCGKDALWTTRNLRLLQDKDLTPEEVKRVAWAAVKRYMVRDYRRNGLEGAVVCGGTPRGQWWWDREGQRGQARTPNMAGQQKRSEGSYLRTCPALYKKA